MSKTFIVTFSHCKGGVGKSTLCYHLAALFLLNCPHLNIGVIDCDDIQNTTYNFFFNKFNNTLKLLYKTNDINIINNIIDNEDLNILFVDTPAGDNDVIRYMMQKTNILITPLQHSLIDIEALISIENDKIVHGSFSQIIRNNINLRAKWILVHNRLPLININDKYTNIINKVAKFLQASIYSLYDRVEYRISFENKITVNELIHNNTNINTSQLAAAKDMTLIYDAIYFLFTNTYNINNR